MSPHEECPYQDGRVVIDPAFKADAPARYARLRELGPIHPAEFHLGLKGSRTPRPPPRPWPPPATSSTSPRWGSARR
ncbi:hypothetical protein [Streptomyces sp. PSKA30]|uniref:hypothetical protein n=1 Tax=Streptomyces sp. PSKA30 TaxID=2874597 RepID=UPI001CD05AC9|nr:hypothetical protein [Streptomyces sp. PSKA30]MBZ9645570.1 hypothetical protein [Streptomyces sp. PSKA30]